jgi:hypothetical protein
MLDPSNPQPDRRNDPHTPLGQPVTIAEQLAYESQQRHAAREAEHEVRLAEHRAALAQMQQQMQQSQTASQAVAQHIQQQPARPGVVDAVLAELSGSLIPGTIEGIRDNLAARYQHLSLDAARALILRDLMAPAVAPAVFAPPPAPPPPPQPGSFAATVGTIAAVAQANQGFGLRRLLPNEPQTPKMNWMGQPPPQPVAGTNLYPIASGMPYRPDNPGEHANANFQRLASVFMDRARNNPAARW